jgi:hypothetical protein
MASRMSSQLLRSKNFAHALAYVFETISKPPNSIDKDITVDGRPVT